MNKEQNIIRQNVNCTSKNTIEYYVTEYYSTGEKCRDVWYQNGKLPSKWRFTSLDRISWQQTEKLRKWYKNDKLHRDNKLPAWIEYKENGAIFQIKWLENVEYGGNDVSNVKNTILNKICNKIKNYCLDRWNFRKSKVLLTY